MKKHRLPIRHRNYRQPEYSKTRNKKAGTVLAVPAFYLKDLAATYSRASYTGTTIGKAAFDGRVRDGIGSDHSFMATKIREGKQAGGGFASGHSEPRPKLQRA